MSSMAHDEPTPGVPSRIASWCAIACVSGLLIAVPLGWWPKDLYGLVKWVMVDMAVIACVAVFIAASLIEGRFTFRRNALNLPLALLIAWSSLSLAVGPHRYYVTKRLHEMLLLAVIYVLLGGAVSTRARKIALAVSALAGLAVISMLGIAHYFGYFPVDSPWGGGLGKRVYATMLNPNFLADFIISLFPLALACFVFVARGRVVSALLAAVMIASFLCLLFTVSWGGMLGWAVSVLLLIAFARGKCRRYAGKRRLFAMLAVLLTIVLLFICLNRATVAADYSGMKYRILYWRASLRMIAERPFTGFGLNSFQPLIPRYLTGVIMSDMKAGVPGRAGYVTVYEGVYAHNEYLALAIELGVVGLLLFVWLVWRLYRQAVRNLRSEGDATEAALQAAAMCGVAALLAQSIVNYPLRVPASAVSFAVLMAFVGSGCATRTARMGCTGIPTSLRWVLAIVALAGGAALIPLAARPLIGERLYVEGRYASYRGDWPVVRDRCRAALRYSITEPELFDLLGETEERLGNLAGAIWAFLRKLELKPYDVYADLKLGTLYERLGMERAAAAYFAQALAHERHDSAEGRERLAELMVRRGRREEARALLEAGLPVHGSEWMLRNSLGIAHAAGGDRDAAMQEFAMALASGGGETAAYNLRVTRMARGNVRAELIGSRQRDWISARVDAARAAMKRGMYGFAASQFQQVLDRYPGYIPALSGMAACYVRSGAMDRASEIWDQARAIDPGYRIELQ